MTPSKPQICMRENGGHTLRQIKRYETRTGFASPIDVGMQASYVVDADVVITEGVKKEDALREVFPDAFVLAVNGVHSALQVKRNWKTLRQDVQGIFAGRENAKIFFFTQTCKPIPTSSRGWIVCARR